mmetsp:Transcript_6494/g.16166  ORF Transcript_6494/g.16166 Transcript_6494/m.16166 type:complete len:223 (+) Transcript_6494:289-957(+)
MPRCFHHAAERLHALSRRRHAAVPEREDPVRRHLQRTRHLSPVPSRGRVFDRAHWFHQASRRLLRLPRCRGGVHHVPGQEERSLERGSKGSLLRVPRHELLVDVPGPGRFLHPLRHGRSGTRHLRVCTDGVPLLRLREHRRHVSDQRLQALHRWAARDGPGSIHRRARVDLRRARNLSEPRAGGPVRDALGGGLFAVRLFVWLQRSDGTLPHLPRRIHQHYQ